MFHVCRMFQTYNENELLQAKLDILSKTNMIDYAIDIRKQLMPGEEDPDVSVKLYSKVKLFCTLYMRVWYFCCYFLILFLYVVQDLKNRRAQVVNQLQELSKEVSLIVSLMNDEKIMKKIETMRDSKALLTFLHDEYDVSVKILPLAISF